MNAKLEISGHAFEVTDRIREYAIKRIEKLNRHLNSLDEIRAELTKVETARNVKDRYVVELTVRGKNLLLRSEERAEDVRKALNEAVEKMDRRMAHYKGKHYHGRGNGQTASELSGEENQAPKLKKQALIIRRKSFDLEPMNENEAIAQMKMLGHEKFYVFLNNQTQSINIAYRRRNGTYGIIEPRM